MPSTPDRPRPLRAVALDHVAINVRDLESSSAFYVRVFGLSSTSHSIFRNVLSGPEFKLHLFQTPDRNPPTDTRDWQHLGIQHVAIVISFDEFERASDVLLEAGAMIEGPLEDTDGRSIYFRDPDGNVIELRTRV